MKITITIKDIKRGRAVAADLAFNPPLKDTTRTTLAGALAAEVFEFLVLKMKGLGKGKGPRVTVVRGNLPKPAK